MARTDLMRRLDAEGAPVSVHAAERIMEMRVPRQAVVDMVRDGSTRPANTPDCTDWEGRMHTHQQWPRWAVVTNVATGQVVTVLFRETRAYTRAGADYRPRSPR